MADRSTFDLYFQKADVDQDGKISGQEAIQFFKGSNLPQPVLAKIWHAADQGHTGFLSRIEFHNALKLVTVAQAGRELTPELMKAALNGPASAQIPAPKIELKTLQQQTISGASLVQTPSSTQAPQGAAQPTEPKASYVRPVVTQEAHRAISQSGQRPSMPPYGQVAPTDTWPPARPITGQIFTSNNRSQTFNAGTGSRSPFGSESFSANPVSNLQQQRPAYETALVPTSTLAPNNTEKQLQTANSQPSFQAQPVKNVMGSSYRPPSSVVGSTAWPKMSDLDVQRYSTVFKEVADRSGKVTGIQARDLFLSWRLPREVLKQVWDLSDQDGDSMLSFREFCTALYLLDRFKEGRPLPPVLPTGFHFDDASVAATRIAEAQAAAAHHNSGHNMPSWQRNPRMLHPSGMMAIPPGAMPHGAIPHGAMPHGAIPHGAMPQGVMPPQQIPQGAAAAGRRREMSLTQQQLKVEEKQIMDSREKLEYYRTKLQELVLFKRKCDNRLAEVSDKAAAEKREVESMSKKYEEKYKQAAEVGTRLISEEAVFREVQARKVELLNAIAEVERGGNPNALLQTRADRISSDLSELEKALAQRGQNLGFKASISSAVELPFGWQPGHQENAADWDEEWDKFDDEGYTCIQDVMDGPSLNIATTTAIPDWDDDGGHIFADGFDFSEAHNNPEEQPVSPKTDSEAGSVRSSDDLWSPKLQPHKKSLLGNSPLSTNIESSSVPPGDGEFGEDASLNNRNSFDDGAPSFDAASVVGGASDDVDERSAWASAFDATDTWPQALGGIKTHVDSDEVNSPSGYGSNEWREKAGDDVSVPNTPLFNTQHSPRNLFFGGETSRLDSFSSSSRVSASPSASASTSVRVYDDADPFSGTGPFGSTNKSASHTWKDF